MSRQCDLTNMHFGKLTAKEPTSERKNGYTVWLCSCDCGNTLRVPSRNLKKGWITSCGCAKKTRYRDLTGRRFGKLQVVSMAEERDEKGQIQWVCKCDCGQTVLAKSGILVNGYKRSCGCLKNPPLKNWIGKTFSNLTVLAYDGKHNKKHYWKCRCVCGKEVSVCQSNLPNGHTTSCGCRNIPSASRHFVEGTCIENIRSRRIPKNNSSGVRGVYKVTRSNKWCAQITFQGKTRYLGCYDTVEEAAKARRTGEEVFDEFLDQYDLTRVESS